MLATDARDLLLDADGDLVMGADLEFASGLSAVAQAVKIVVQTFRGEWFLDLDFGVPYFERDGVPASEALLGQRFNETKARAAFRDAILSVDGVDSLEELNVTFNVSTRRLDVTWRTLTVFGETSEDTLELGV